MIYYGGKRKINHKLQELQERTNKSAAFLREQEALLENAKRFLENYTRETTATSHRIQGNLDYCNHLITEQDHYTKGTPVEMVLIGQINGSDRHVPINALRIPPATHATDMIFLESLLQLKDLNHFDFFQYPNIQSKDGEPVWMPTCDHECSHLIEKFVTKDPDVSHRNYRKLVNHLLQCEGCKKGLKFKNQELSFPI
jgi:hypothetical protein